MPNGNGMACACACCMLHVHVHVVHACCMCTYCACACVLTLQCISVTVNGFHATQAAGLIHVEGATIPGRIVAELFEVHVMAFALGAVVLRRRDDAHPGVSWGRVTRPRRPCAWEWAWILGVRVQWAHTLKCAHHCGVCLCLALTRLARTTEHFRESGSTPDAEACDSAEASGCGDGGDEGTSGGGDRGGFAQKSQRLQAQYSQWRVAARLLHHILQVASKESCLFVGVQLSLAVSGWCLRRGAQLFESPFEEVCSEVDDECFD